MSDTKVEIIEVVHSEENPERPWVLVFTDVARLKRARAILNYPVHHFETEEKAIEVAEMLRDIIDIDGVEVEGETWLRDNSGNAEFFHNISSHIEQ